MPADRTKRTGAEVLADMLAGYGVTHVFMVPAGLRDAHLAHSPVIAMTGGRDPKTKFRQVYQEVDDVPAFEPVTKLNATVDEVARIPDMVRQAFRAAVSGAPGPVHLQFRGNEGQLDASTGSTAASRPSRGASSGPTARSTSRIAQEMGALGIRVEKPGDIAPALERALAADRPVVIDVVTDIEALAPLAVSGG